MQLIPADSEPFVPVVVIINPFSFVFILCCLSLLFVLHLCPLSFTLYLRSLPFIFTLCPLSLSFVLYLCPLSFVFVLHLCPLALIYQTAPTVLHPHQYTTLAMVPVTVANFNAKTNNFSDGIATPVLNTFCSLANAQEFAIRITAVGDNTSLLLLPNLTS